jgi:multidrug efflux pump subunit AcrA (membrane-fusion protein)
MTERSGVPWLSWLLAALCVGAITTGALLVGPQSESATAQSRVVKAQEGVVQSTVSGSGTLSPASKVGVNFATSGTLRELFVSVGEHVVAGQLLAEIDPSSAESSLRSAEMNLATEQASYQGALEGLTPVEVREAAISTAQARASVKSAEQSLRQSEETVRSDQTAARAAVSQAEIALKQAEQSVKLEATSQQDAITEATSQKASDEKTVSEAEAQLEEARSELASERSKPSESKTAGGQSGVASAESKVSSAESAVKSAQAKVTQDGSSIISAQNNQSATALKGQQSIQNARNALANDKQNQSATKLKDDQSVAQGRTSVRSAKQALQATLASNEAKAAPPTHATVVSTENAVKSAELSVENARKTLTETRLHAPAAGVVASIKDSPGEAVSGTGSSSASSASTGGASSASTSGAASSESSSPGSGTGSSPSSGASATGAGSGGSTGTGTRGSGGGGAGSSAAGAGSGAIGDGGAGQVTGAVYSGGASTREIADQSSATAGTSSSGGSDASSGSESSSSAFIELTDLQGYQLVVPLSESEIIHVHVGQPATVTVEALEGRKFAAHVVSVAVLATSNSGVVSYDVTFQLDQVEAALKPGMSASAEIIVSQAEGVNVPTSAISGDAVTVIERGKRVRRAVVTGLAGNSTTLILSGLKAGEEIALPVASTSSATSLTSRLGRLGGLGGGGLKGGGLGGGGAFFRGGG